MPFPSKARKSHCYSDTRPRDTAGTPAWAKHAPAQPGLKGNNNKHISLKHINTKFTHILTCIHGLGLGIFSWIGRRRLRCALWGEHLGDWRACTAGCLSPGTRSLVHPQRRPAAPRTIFLQGTVKNVGQPGINEHKQLHIYCTRPVTHKGAEC